MVQQLDMMCLHEAVKSTSRGAHLSTAIKCCVVVTLIYNYSQVPSHDVNERTTFSQDDCDGSAVAHAETVFAERLFIHIKR